MATLRIITSGAYVGSELSAEFGLLPPAFLPIGVSRLFERQLERLGPGPIHLTLPESFKPQPSDLRRLHDAQVTLVPVPDGLQLGESIIYAMNAIAAPPGPVQMLHGDTLIEEPVPDFMDMIALHQEGDDYSWAAVEIDNDRIVGLETIGPGTGQDSNRPVVCGYFSFSSSISIRNSIVAADGDFISGLDFYVKENIVRGIYVERWLDFGHAQTYFRSRRSITTARSFNTLSANALTVTKSSDNREKIIAEAHWLEKLPAAIKPFSARLISSQTSSKKGFYETEYQFAPTLSELLVFSSIGRPTWRNILRSCGEFLQRCASHKGSGSSDAVLADLTVKKLTTRLQQYSIRSGFDLTKPNRLNGLNLPPLLDVSEEVISIIDYNTGRRENVMHGDFCFSNILYNSRAARVILIDPRGYVRTGKPSIFGDTNYDLAKFMHSVTGYYDHILAGRYALTRPTSHDFTFSLENTPQLAWLRDAALELGVDGVCAGDRSVRAIVITLFLSMLPLHADRPDRQSAFIANALRLYVDLERPTL